MEDTLGDPLLAGSFVNTTVLILVLMEDTLGAQRLQLVSGIKVLILVLMEDTLGVNNKSYKFGSIDVLILVLMEDTLGAELISVTQ